MVPLCGAYGLLVSQMNSSDTDTSIFCIVNMHLRISQQLQHTVNTHHAADTKLDCSCNNHSFKVAQRGKYYMHSKLVQALDLHIGQDSTSCDVRHMCSAVYLAASHDYIPSKVRFLLSTG